MRFHDITAIFENVARKGRIHRFDFLQNGHIGLRLIQPIAQGGDACLDAVNVKCRNFHDAPGLLWGMGRGLYRKGCAASAR